MSKDAFDKLQQYGNLPEVEVCPVCVEAEFTTRLARAQLTDAVTTFDELNRGDEYIMPKQWVDDWKKGALPDGVLPTSSEYTLFCQHDQPWGERKGMPVSPEAVALLRSVVGDFPAFLKDDELCRECQSNEEEDNEARKDWAKAAKMEKRIKSQLDCKPAPFGVDHYVLPETFVEAWLNYLVNPQPKPELHMVFCEHGLIDFDPMVEKVHYLTEAGWKLLCEQ